MHGQVRCCIERRLLASNAVIVDSFLEAAKPFGASVHAGLGAKLRKVRRLESQRLQRRQFPRNGRGRHVQRSCMLSDAVSGNIVGSQTVEPCLPVRCEHRERRAGARHHLVAFEDNLILERVKRDAVARECVGHFAIAIDRHRLVVVIAVDRRNAKIARETRDRSARPRMFDNQRTATLSQCPIELAHAAVDELDAPIDSRRQGIENFPVEDERRVYGRSTG